MSIKLNRKINVLMVYILNILYYCIFYFKWNKIKNRFMKKRVFLIGNGPSLNITPLYLLKDENTLCFNRFHLLHERLNWQETMFMVADGLVVRDLVEEINNLVIKEIEYCFVTRFSLSTAENFGKYINSNNNLYWMLPRKLKSKFDFNLPLVNIGGSVAIAGLQVLKYMGFSEIYLLGVDMNYQIHKTAKTIKGKDIESQEDDDPNHFDPRYFGAGRKYHQPDKEIVDTIMSSFDKISKVLKNNGCKVYNCTVGGNLESFERKDLKEVLNISEDVEKEIFNQLLLEKTGMSIYEAQNSSFVQLLELSEANKVIPKKVYTHLPLGPFQNKIYLVDRQIIKNSGIKN